MDNKLLYFLVGAAAGAVVSWWITKSHYENEEFESIDDIIDDTGKEEKEEIKSQKDLAKAAREKPSIMDVVRKDAHDYTQYYKSSTPEKKQDEKEKIEVRDEIKKVQDKIEYISPDEFGEIEDYNTTTWTYLSDGTLLDDIDEPVEKKDIQAIVGLDFADHFGDFEPDAVHVANHDIEMYIEVLKDARTFDEFMETQPAKPEIRREDE